MSRLQVVELPVKRELAFSIGLSLFHLTCAFIDDVDVYRFVDGHLAGQPSADTHGLTLPVDLLVGLHFGSKGRSRLHRHFIRGVIGVDKLADRTLGVDYGVVGVVVHQFGQRDDAVDHDRAADGNLLLYVCRAYGVGLAFLVEHHGRVGRQRVGTVVRHGDAGRNLRTYHRLADVGLHVGGMSVGQRLVGDEQEASARGIAIGRYREDDCMRVVGRSVLLRLHRHLSLCLTARNDNGLRVLQLGIVVAAQRDGERLRDVGYGVAANGNHRLAALLHGAGLRADSKGSSVVVEHRQFGTHATGSVTRCRTITRRHPDAGIQRVDAVAVLQAVVHGAEVEECGRHTLLHNDGLVAVVKSAVRVVAQLHRNPGVGVPCACQHGSNSGGACRLAHLVGCQRQRQYGHIVVVQQDNHLAGIEAL